MLKYIFRMFVLIFACFLYEGTYYNFSSGRMKDRSFCFSLGFNYYMQGKNFKYRNKKSLQSTAIHLPHLPYMIPYSYWALACAAVLSSCMALCDFCPSDQRFAHGLVCSHIRLPSDSTSRWTPLPLAISFPLPDGFQMCIRDRCRRCFDCFYDFSYQNYGRSWNQDGIWCRRSDKTYV